MVLSCDILPNFSDESPKFPPTGGGAVVPQPSPGGTPESYTHFNNVVNAETCPFIPFHPNTRCFCQITWGTPSGHKCSGALRFVLKGAHNALRHWPGLSFSFFGMRICTRIIPLRVEPWIKMDVPQPPYCRQRK